MAPLLVPFFSQATGWTVTIDGVTYRPALVDSSGRLVVSLQAAGVAIEVTQDTPADLRAAVYGIDGLTQRQAKVDGAGRLIVTTTEDHDSYNWTRAKYTSAQTSTSLVGAPGANKQLAIIGLQYSASVIATMQFQDTTLTSAPIWGPHYFPANGGIALAPGEVIFRCSTTAPLYITTTGAGNHQIDVQYLILDV